MSRIFPIPILLQLKGKPISLDFRDRSNAAHSSRFDSHVFSLLLLAIIIQNPNRRLWNKFSGCKFGYSVQKRKWRQVKGDFEGFCRKIGWNTKDGEVERKKRWFGASEFIYNVKKAPEGHLPLTSALRGTSLLKSLLNHPVWDNEDWKEEPQE